MKITYKPYRPAGFTDDLGIIADRNQYVPEQPAGWYVLANYPAQFYAMMDYINETNMPHEVNQYGVVLFKEEDVSLFILRWQ